MRGKTSSTAERLVVFVKAPRAGFVKTRLARSLGADKACTAYRRLVDRLFARLRGLHNVELRFAPDDAEAEIQPWLAPGWTHARQGTGDLGERLVHAFGEGFKQSVRRVVVIGSDCPEVTVEDIRSAWRALASHDVVLGPACDGGYWLIGLRAPRSELFEGIPWSTPQVYAETELRARRAGLSICKLRELSDVDTLEDWRKFVAGSRD